MPTRSMHPSAGPGRRAGDLRAHRWSARPRVCPPCSSITPKDTRGRCASPAGRGIGVYAGAVHRQAIDIRAPSTRQRRSPRGSVLPATRKEACNPIPGPERSSPSTRPTGPATPDQTCHEGVEPPSTDDRARRPAHRAAPCHSGPPAVDPTVWPCRLAAPSLRARHGPRRSTGRPPSDSSHAAHDVPGPQRSGRRDPSSGAGAPRHRCGAGPRISPLTRGRHPVRTSGSAHRAARADASTTIRRRPPCAPSSRACTAGTGERWPRTVTGSGDAVGPTRPPGDRDSSCWSPRRRVGRTRSALHRGPSSDNGPRIGHWEP